MSNTATINTDAYTYDAFSDSSTVATATATYSQAVFPNGEWAARMYSNTNSADDLDIELYNYCYLPYNFLSHYKRFQVTSSCPPRPTYLDDEAPCKRQAAINTNCYFENTNSTFLGLQVPTDPEALASQQQCYCITYLFFDSALGCQACFQDHGGIEGFHWYPDAYVNAFSSSYCAASSVTTDFYASYSDWSSTQTDVSVPMTTASNVLGTQTDMSLYYTYNAQVASAEATSTSTSLAISLQLLSLGDTFIMSLVIAQLAFFYILR